MMLIRDLLKFKLDSLEPVNYSKTKIDAKFLIDYSTLLIAVRLRSKSLVPAREL